VTRLSLAFMVDSVPFTPAVVDGQTSLGGSESSCLGVARALKARGHDVHIFATQLHDDARGRDAWDIVWHPLSEFVSMNQFIEWDVVVALRMYPFFENAIHARMRVLWNQDLLPPKHGPQVMAFAWAYDQVLYVSDYHRRQWEDLVPELKGIGAVTKNGYDPAHVPPPVTKDANTIIHISRPERGLTPLLKMWPELKKRRPEARLQLCRYSSMYDEKGWGQVCGAFDEWTQEVHDTVGGIEWLGELNKAELYKAIAEAAVMWYPGVSTFAETSCIAAIEAQANGTPFVGSLRGALPETARPSYDAGLLITGEPEKDDRAYWEASIAAVLRLMDGCEGGHGPDARAYKELQKAGRQHVKGYTYEALAAEWEQRITDWFAARYEANKLGVLRRLMWEEDLSAAALVARDIRREGKSTPEVDAAAERADQVEHGRLITPELYAKHAIQSPVMEAEYSARFNQSGQFFDKSTRMLDVACGNGAGAIAFTRMHPNLSIVGIDYSAENIERAKAGAIEAGVADRCTFLVGGVWDFDNGTPDLSLEQVRAFGPYDAMFVGEFVEHVVDCSTLIDWLETFCEEGATVVYTCPSGPFIELAGKGEPLQRTHVHHFRHDDIRTVWGDKDQLQAKYLPVGVSRRGVPVGHWLIAYATKAGAKAHPRDQAAVAAKTRPMRTLSVGMIVKDAEADLARCLDSVWPIADEIIVGDTGSTDKSKAIAEEWGAKVIDIPDVMEQPEGFAGARNAVLERCSGDWFMWIDADEQLGYARKVPRFLQGEVFRGFALHQCHLMIDATPHFDRPVRIFKNDGRIKFYGCVHEQPQQDDCNGEIVPAFEMSSEDRTQPLPLLVHTGYMTDAIRRHKMHTRNLPLLVKDQQVFPDRKLGKVLTMRDYVLISDEDANRHGGMTDKAHAGYAHAVRLFLDYFDNPADTFHAIARPFYETAIQRLGKGIEVELALAGKFGGLKERRAKPERMWVRDMDEYERVLIHKTRETAKPMRDIPYKTEPFVLPEQGVSA
jgi:glycosyltransferase involved in cell wall biosynthesis/2-polyprenyl-3-methyl-5-hydroxy-6-metoxy-1,4-benzoquinol methylase